MTAVFIGAHPDDCEVKCGGTAALLTQSGHHVHFVSVTDGSAGHQTDHGPAIAARRRKECNESARRLGLSGYHILPIPDGHLQPTLEARDRIIRIIRETRADLVITHRPCDYHPDHRYTATLVQDSAYLVMVPGVCPDAPPLNTNPLYLYMEDHFQRPYAFRPDIRVDITSVWSKKIASLDAHASQFYEWLPWVDHEKLGHELDSVPTDPAERLTWLDHRFRHGRSDLREAFEICEYGRQPNPGEFDILVLSGA